MFFKLLKLRFLSCLYGSEQYRHIHGVGAHFLSCLYGSELFRTSHHTHHSFLSCLYGSELNERFIYSSK
ncbi:TPA: hypothetical protein I8Z13_002242 [Legionella pneumophila]|nr:hypothetical protein [Legionella pneumophila]